jgi:hypothetical protein
MYDKWDWTRKKVVVKRIVQNTEIFLAATLMFFVLQFS